MARELDVSRWNLWWPVAVIAACGPRVAAGDGEGDADGSGDTNPPTSTSVGEGGQCGNDSECPDGYACIDGVCEYQCYCGCGVAPPPGNRFRCSEAGNYECYADEDCGDGEVCDRNECVPDPCASIPSLGDGVDVDVSWATGPIRQIGFMPYASRGEIDTVVVAGNQLAEIGGHVHIEHAAEILSAAWGDLNHDGVADVVIADASAVWVYPANPANGRFEAPGDPTMLAATQLAIADTNGDDVLDVLAKSADGVWLLPGNGDATLDAPQTWLLGASDRIAVVDLVEDEAIDFVSSAAGEVSYVFGPGGELVGLGAPAGTSRTVEFLTADFDGSGVGDLVMVNEDGRMATWLGPPVDTAPIPGELGVGVLAATFGRFDSNGSDDLLTGHTDGTITLRFGAPLSGDGTGEPFGCATNFASTITPALLVTGTYDGESPGPELFVSDGTHVRVLFLLPG